MKKELDDYLYELTMNLKEGSEEAFSAYKIAESLQLNRSTISSYLNQAFREGELIKIKSYPVLFLHRRALENASIQIDKAEYESIKELFAQDRGNAIEEIIGANGSLKEAIDQIKTAVLYPHNGLPILLMGVSGSGKTFWQKKFMNTPRNNR